MSARLRSPWTWLAVLAVVLVGIYPLLSDDLYYQNMIILSMVFAVGAVGLNIITGYAGYVSLGQGAFLGLGAYVVGIGVTKVGGSPWLWIGAAGVVAALFAAAAGRRRDASARPFVRDPHDRVPVPAADRRDQLGLAHERHRRHHAAAADMEHRHPVLALLLLADGDPGRLDADVVVDQAQQVRHGPDRDPRGRGQGRDGRRQHARLQDPRLRRQRRLRRHGGRRLRLLPRLHRPDRDVQHPPERPDHPVAAAGRARDALGARPRRLHRRGAERVLEQRPRRRQLPPARLRRAARAGGAVHVARHHPDGG